ncbi:MAG: AAA domain-containing protein [Desulfobacterales bacterium]|nr:AAA domain-containing protein [Desulfobacterales bacterium]
MKLNQEYQPEFESLKELLIQMAQEPSPDILPGMIADHMARRPHVALVRVWVVRPGDDCDRCPARDRCPTRTSCLHLAASGGAALSMDESRGKIAPLQLVRLPLGMGGIGRAAAAGKSLRIPDVSRDPRFLSENPWVADAGVMGAGIQPMAFKGEVLGAIEIYSRIDLDRVREGGFWLRMIANHAAFAIANARAFEQIERLKAQLELENAYLREEIHQVQSFGDVVGRGPALLNTLKQVELVAPTDASVLILGESGVGKELIAREIHGRGPRKNHPMIRVNCAAIPGELYESEFFGHVRGSFTGAVKDRVGRFQAAHRGTLFLDEVGEIPLALQGKLLRVLQEGRYERIGEEKTRQVDVRIISATNRSLKRDVENGRFRRDLYYRLNVFPLEIAPLRRRKEDIPLLAEHFLDKISKKMNRPRPSLTRADIAALSSYDWPGNVRELQNVIERALIISRSGPLLLDLPAGVRSNPPMAGIRGPDDTIPAPGIVSDAEMKNRVRQNIMSALKECGGKIYGPDGAAALLGVKPTTLSSRIKRLKIPKRELNMGHGRIVG